MLEFEILQELEPNAENKRHGFRKQIKISNMYV